MQKEMRPDELQAHMISTYFSLRRFMWIVALLTPAVVVLWGLFWKVPWQDSISAYYFAPEGDLWNYSPYPVRVLFVGILFALGACLVVYKGFTHLEDWLMNGAGVFAILVAMFPMYPEQGYIAFSRTVHFASAIGLFLCLGATAVWCNEGTLKWLASPSERRRFKRSYQIIGWFMILFPAVGAALAYLFNAAARNAYWMEAAGIETFAAYWALKNVELARSGAEGKAMKGVTPPRA